jgi:hypothetical protein
MVQLGLARLVLHGDCYVRQIQQAFALKLLQLKVNLFRLIRFIESNHK